MTNKQIYELTENTSPSADDVVAIDQAADNVSKKVKIQNLPKAFNITDNRLLGRSAGSAGAMQEISVGTGLSLSGGTLTATGSGGADKYPMEARLTLETGVAVSTTNQSAKGTLYLTKYMGDQVAVYDGVSAWSTIALGADISLSLAGLTASRPHDIWVYSNSGTLTLEATAWTNDTTRATALAMQNGIYVKTGDATRRYVGTIYVNASNQCNATTSLRQVWNYYNRIERHLSCVDTTDSWTYTTTTWRSANNNTTDGVGRVSVVIGVVEDAIDATCYGIAVNSSNVRASVGVGINSTSANSAQYYGSHVPTATSGNLSANFKGYLSAGYNYIQRLEISGAGSTTTWYGDAGVTYNQSGMTAMVRG